METIDLIALFTFGTMVITIINLLKIFTMGQELDNLTTEVSETKGIMASAKALIVGFNQKLKDAIAAGNPAALTALSQELDTSTNDLAQAIADNPLPGENPTPTE